MKLRQIWQIRRVIYMDEEETVHKMTMREALTSFQVSFKAKLCSRRLLSAQRSLL